MLHAFIDTNVLLRFYSYTNDNLDEADKLKELINNHEIELYLTEQTRDEFFRNRDKELFESLDRVEKVNFAFGMPRLFVHYQEAKDLNEYLKNAKAAKGKLLEKIRADLNMQTLKADEVLQDIFDVATFVKRTPSILDRARVRKELGNPPGKQGQKDSIGDQVNWESLLDSVPAGTDIHIISRDGDFSDRNIASSASSFIKMEWKTVKSADVYLYDGLSEFTLKHFPHIKLASDVKKASAIKELCSSPSFYWTHVQVGKLDSIFDEISLEDALLLFEALLVNSQIKSIMNDTDIDNFYNKLYQKFWLSLPKQLDDKLEEAFPNLVPF